MGIFKINKNSRTRVLCLPSGNVQIVIDEIIFSNDYSSNFIKFNLNGQTRFLPIVECSSDVYYNKSTIYKPEIIKQGTKSKLNINVVNDYIREAPSEYTPKNEIEYYVSENGRIFLRPKDSKKYRVNILNKFDDYDEIDATSFNKLKNDINVKMIRHNVLLNSIIRQRGFVTPPVTPTTGNSIKIYIDSLTEEMYIKKEDAITYSAYLVRPTQPSKKYDGLCRIYSDDKIKLMNNKITIKEYHPKEVLCDPKLTKHRYLVNGTLADFCELNAAKRGIYCEIAKNQVYVSSEEDESVLSDKDHFFRRIVDRKKFEYYINIMVKKGQYLASKESLEQIDYFRYDPTPLEDPETHWFYVNQSIINNIIKAKAADQSLLLKVNLIKKPKSTKKYELK